MKDVISVSLLKRKCTETQSCFPEIVSESFLQAFPSSNSRNILVDSNIC